MKRITAIVIILLLSEIIIAQTGEVRGLVTDYYTGETLIGVHVLYGENKGTITDINGLFSVNLRYGEYTLKFSYVGYENKLIKIIVNNNFLDIKVRMTTVTLEEVNVVADIATTRETPVAFTNITPVQIKEELASQDIPMILNRTPGVYATQQGGGDGDARINIRGFSQRNVAVMIDGIPVNDMENGWVYWSNWFGLDAVTRNIQIQRGLGVSKLAIPSVGGTMNIITKNIGNKREYSIQQEAGNDGFMRSSLGINSGQLEKGWGFTFAGSYKSGDGWIDQTYTKAWFYFLRIDKKLGRHIISLSGMGAPQEHGQKPYKKPVALFDAAKAHSLGIDTSDNSYFNATYINKVTMFDKGIRYNPHWGNIKRYRNVSGDTSLVQTEVLNERINYYHKPQFSLRDFWNVNEKLYLSNIVYLSVGKGGGTRAKVSIKAADYMADGQINWQKFYNANAFSPWSIDPLYSNTEHKSSQFIRSLVNNHFWYGYLSTFSYTLNKLYSLSGGIDLRSYRGEHYTEVYDLLGGDYTIDMENANQLSPVKRKGDKISYHDEGIVKWGGLFSQIEYKTEKLATFVNLSFAYSGYKRIDYFKEKKIIAGDTVIYLGYYDTAYYKGEMYTRDEKFIETDWKWIPGYTVKGGMNYNFTEQMNAFINLGYISKAPRFNNVYDYSNNLLGGIENEVIRAIELGFSFYDPDVTLNFNTYMTFWENKPVDNVPFVTITDPVTGEERDYYYNINGVDAEHKGIEIEFAHRLGKRVIWETLLSLGDWKWNSGDSVYIYDENQNLVDTRFFNAKGVHVGDAAQFQYVERIRYEIIKNLYFKLGLTYFGKHYANFDPLSLDGSAKTVDAKGNSLDSWKIPDYFLVDVHAGYTFKFNKLLFEIHASVLNLLDKKYISDADNNDSYSSNTQDFDAKSAGVFFGLGRRFNTSLRITFK